MKLQERRAIGVKSSGSTLNRVFGTVIGILMISALVVLIALLILFMDPDRGPVSMSGAYDTAVGALLEQH